MNRVGSIESRVLEILKDCPLARYDDMALVSQYYSRYGYRKMGELPFGYVMSYYKKFGLPCFETIRRARQRVQALVPEVDRNRASSGGKFSLLLEMEG